MKALIRTLALGAMLVGGAASAAVTVTFVHPENYPDMPLADADRAEVLNGISQHFAELGRNLPQGTDLHIDVLDLDLAGNLVPSPRNARDLRVLTGGADWPRMRLHYSVEANGSVVDSGDVKLQDMNYQHSINRVSDTDPLRYEKQMIDDWFYRSIAPRRRG